MQWLTPEEPSEQCPFDAERPGSAGEPTGEIPVVGEAGSAEGPGWTPSGSGTGSPGVPAWTAPPGAGGTVPPWGWPSGSWPGGSWPGSYSSGPTPPRRRRTGLIMAALLAGLLLAGGGIGAGVTLAFAGSTTPAKAASGGKAASGVSGSRVNAQAIAAAVDQGVVDVNAQLAYQQSESEGTGMILTSNGEVLTNNHVIDGSSSIEVRPVDGQRSYSATVIGVDPAADVALLQIHGASGLNPVPVGDSSQVKIGDTVVAIGNALGLGGTPTVTEGTITALNRSITASDENGANPENLTGMIQTSAQLASGDSGGPLVNASGKVVGMDTAAPGGQIGSQSSGTQSIGWAIPINKAMSVVDQIRSGSSSSDILIGPRPFIGVDVEDASQAAQGGGFPGGGVPGGGPFGFLPPPATDSGAYVTQVISGSPADSAGIQAGDVIVSFDGQTVASEKELSGLESPLHPGSSVSIGWVDSSGGHHSATITLATGPAV